MSKLNHIMQIKGKEGPTLRSGYSGGYDCHFEPPSVHTFAVAQGGVSKPVLENIPILFEALTTDMYDFTLGNDTQMDEITLIYLKKAQGKSTEEITLKITLSHCYFIGNVSPVESQSGLAQIHTSIGFESLQLEAFQYDSSGKQKTHKTFKYDNVKREAS